MANFDFTIELDDYDVAVSVTDCYDEPANFWDSPCPGGLFYDYTTDQPVSGSDTDKIKEAIAREFYALRAGEF
jgi:hypothetical protein